MHIFVFEKNRLNFFFIKKKKICSVLVFFLEMNTMLKHSYRLTRKGDVFSKCIFLSFNTGPVCFNSTQSQHVYMFAFRINSNTSFVLVNLTFFYLKVQPARIASSLKHFLEACKYPELFLNADRADYVELNAKIASVQNEMRSI